MPVTQDIRDAIEAGNAELAKQLVKEVSAKRDGKGLSGHDLQEFERQIARIRALEPVVVVEPEPIAEAEPPKPKPKARTRKR